MLEKGRARVRDLSLVMVVFGIIVPLGKVAAEGNLVGELTDPMQAGPLAVWVLSSAVMHAVTRSRRVSTHNVLRAALVWEVVVAFAMAFAQYWGAFGRLEASQINFDVVGASMVATWMVLFTVIVPVRPRGAAIALAACACAPGLVYGIDVRVGLAPPLQPVQAFFVLAFPYVTVGIVAWFAARTIYQLGRQLRATQQMGSYHLERRLGIGGMGEVWSASHRMLARPAAVKLIRADALGRDPQEVLVATERFEREAQVTAGLKSPHTVDLYDFGSTEDGNLFYVMELLDGVDLGTLVSEYGPVEPQRVVHILRQCCASLAEAHAGGLVHRDIKPANIFLCRYGLEHDFVKVLDFGLVKRVSNEVALTRVGTVAGTPSFMPPEVAMGQPTDGRADLYALGCVAYWLLTGCLVFEGETAMALAVAHVEHAPVPPSQRSELAIPAELEAIVMRCLEKDPAARPADAQALGTLLAELPSEQAWTADQAAAWWQTHRPVATSHHTVAATLDF